jgi:ABC-type branched-subunit amino acid transport system substrate-binding protein
MINGKLYIFGGQASKDGFELDEKKNLALAESYWKDEVAGNNSFFQRWKRLIFRVPHYQSGDDLAKAIAAAKAKGGAAK